MSSLVSKSGEIYSKHSHKSIPAFFLCAEEKKFGKLFPCLIIMQAALILFKLVSFPFHAHADYLAAPSARNPTLFSDWFTHPNGWSVWCVHFVKQSGATVEREEWHFWIYIPYYFW
jgi:hypothetical protein